MSSKKEQQQKVGRPQKPRGQQTGFAGNPDQNREAMKETPAVSGSRKRANRMSADKSAQQQAGDAVTPRSVSPSVPAAAPTGAKLGETGGEKALRKRQAKRRQSK